jgi:hypothetical protein
LAPLASEAARSRVRAALARPKVQAALIFLLLLAVYLANGDVLPGNDAAASVRLAGKLVSKHKLVFTPEEDPFMFEWRLKTAEGDRHAHFHSWRSSLNGEPVRRAYERGDLSQPEPNYYLMRTRQAGMYANRYGVGAALFAVPFVAAVYPFARDLYDRPSAGILWFTTKVAAACAVAASAMLLFLAALPWLRPKTAVWLTLAYGLGTCVWSSSSQALWQHGPMEFFLALGTYFLLQRERPRAAYWVGLSYAMAFVCRPTGAVVVAAATIYYAICDRRALLRCVAGGLPVTVALAAYNLHIFGTLIVLGQVGVGGGATAQAPAAFTLIPMAAAAEGSAATGSQLFHTSLLQGLGGILLSPSRGLLLFTPVVVFAFWGLIRVFRDSRFVALRPVGLAAVALFLVVARWYGWAGGWAFGPRLLADAGMLLAFLAIPVAEEIRKSRARAAAFGVCLAWSVAVQVVGAFAYDVVGWNERVLFVVTQPGKQRPILFTDVEGARREIWAHGGAIEQRKVNVDSAERQARLRSIRDSQLLYYVEHFLEARRLKRIAIEKFLKDSA